MSNIRATAKKIVSFARLPKGWHYGKGSPSSEHAMAAALTVLGQLALMGFHDTDAFPGIDGAVQVTAYDRHDFYEYNVSLDGTITVVHDRGDTNISYDARLSLTETLQKIEYLAFEKCEQPDLSTPSTLTASGEDFQVKPSIIPQTDQVYPLSTANASTTMETRFVLTYPSFTLDRWVTP